MIVTPLYVDDALLSKIVLGEKARLGRTFIRQLEGEGMPRARQLFGSMRYLPSVLDFFDRLEGRRLGAPAAIAEDGSECFGP